MTHLICICGVLTYRRAIYIWNSPRPERDCGRCNLQLASVTSNLNFTDYTIYFENLDGALLGLFSQKQFIYFLSKLRLLKKIRQFLKVSFEFQVSSWINF